MDHARPTRHATHESSPGMRIVLLRFRQHPIAPGDMKGTPLDDQLLVSGERARCDEQSHGHAAPMPTTCIGPDPLGTRGGSALLPCMDHARGLHRHSPRRRLEAISIHSMRVAIQT